MENGDLNISEIILPTQNIFYIVGFYAYFPKKAKSPHVCVITCNIIRNLWMINSILEIFPWLYIIVFVHDI